MFGYSMWGNYLAVAIPLVALGTQSGIIDVIHVSANVVSAGFFIHNGVVRGLRWLETQGWYPFSPTHKYEASVGSEKNGGYRNKLVVTCLHSGLNRTFPVLSFPEGGLRAPNLKQFSIRDCKKLKSLPEQMHTQLPSLEDLVIERCPEIQCFPEEGLPSSLKTLHIGNCQKMMISQTIWDLQRLSSLMTMAIVRFDNNVFPDEVLLPSNLKNLKITYHLSSLQSLSVYSCLNLESLNGLPYLSSLQYLRIKNCLNLKSLSGLQYLPSLQSLVISYCPNPESLNVLQYMAFLQYLEMFHCHNLRCFPEEILSSSLSNLQIWCCENLESLPVSLPSSLSTLRIYSCPKLKARIERDKGEDWPQSFSYTLYHGWLQTHLMKIGPGNS